MSNELLNIAIKAAIEAGEAIMEIYETENFEVEIKKDNSPLTIADIASHDIIISHLEKTGIPILSEEGKNIPYKDRKDWNQLWIVDPIDGTKEFIKRNGEFTVNIALIENQIPILGVVYTPATKDLYFASENIGAFKVNTSCISTDSMTEEAIKNLLSSAQKLPIKSDRNIFTVVASRSHMSAETEVFIRDMEKVHGNVNLISKGSSLKLCMVAEGIADCYPRFAPTMEWDTAAGQSICMYAGFDVFDMKTNKTMLYNRVELLNSWFLVK